MSTGDGNGSNGYSYGRARVAGGLALIFVTVILALLDAFSETYALEPITLGLLLGTGAVLLGVEAGRKLLGS